MAFSERTANYQDSSQCSKQAAETPLRLWQVTVLLLLLLAGCRRLPAGQESLPTATPVTRIVAATAMGTPSPVKSTAATLVIGTPSPKRPSPAAPTPTPMPASTLMPSSTPPPTPVDTATSTPRPTATASATVDASLAAYPRLPAQPSDPQPFLSRFRLVSYYGAAGDDTLGILNLRAESVLVSDLMDLAAQYQALAPQREVLPTFHLVVTVADPWFGDDRNFNHRASAEAIERWLSMAEAEGFAVVLDVQPGHAPILEELEGISAYLRHPYVHLALDSEYAMGLTEEGLFEVPGQVLGSLHAEQINAVQERLEAIAQEIGVNKVLIIHQFEDQMVPDKENILNYPHVELVIDSDGFGGPDKVRDYQKYAQEPGFEYGGFKLYRNWDSPLLAPAEVLELEPPPVVIIYQ